MTTKTCTVGVLAALLCVFDGAASASQERAQKPTRIMASIVENFTRAPVKNMSDVASESIAILTATVISATPRAVRSPEGVPIAVETEYVLDVGSAVKANAVKSRDRITLVVPGGRLELQDVILEDRSSDALNLVPGEAVLLYLQKEGDHYRPTLGKNGVFRIDKAGKLEPLGRSVGQELKGRTLADAKRSAESSR